MISNSEKIISIIIPAYNAEKYISKCLDSLINQTYKNLEIIVVNDGSTDNTLKILEKYASDDNRIKVLNQKNSGASQARNNALKIFSGDYLMFADADDWLDENTCESALNELIENNVDVVMWTYVREFGSLSAVKQIFDEDKIYFDKNAVSQRLHRRFLGLYKEELARPENGECIVPVWGKLYKSEVIRKANAEFVDLKKVGSCEDGLYNLEVFGFVNSAVFINKPWYHYRKDNSGSQTVSYREKLYSQWQNLYEEMQSYIDCNKCPEMYQLSLYNRIAIGVFHLSLNLVHSDMTALEKIKNIKSILKEKRYINAYKYLELKYFPIYWKIYYFMAKYKMSAGVYLLTKVIDFLMSRR